MTTTEETRQQFKADWDNASEQCPVEGCTSFRPLGVWFDSEGNQHKACVFCVERLGYDIDPPWIVRDEDGNIITDEAEDDDCCGYCGGSGGADPEICRMCDGTGR